MRTVTGKHFITWAIKTTVYIPCERDRSFAMSSSGSLKPSRWWRLLLWKEIVKHERIITKDTFRVAFDEKKSKMTARSQFSMLYCASQAKVFLFFFFLPGHINTVGFNRSVILFLIFSKDQSQRAIILVGKLENHFPSQEHHKTFFLLPLQFYLGDLLQCCCPIVSFHLDLRSQTLQVVFLYFLWEPK